MDGRMGEWVDGGMDGWMDEWCCNDSHQNIAPDQF